MSVSRKALLYYLAEIGFTLVREGGNHSIWGKG
jgi:hypothetical protein